MDKQGTQTLEILIVEDKDSHFSDAVAAVEQLQAMGAPILVDYARDKASAIERMQAKQYSAVITDIFMPSGEDASSDSKDRKACWDVLEIEAFLEKAPDSRWLFYEDAVSEWKSGYSLAPMGVLIAEEARKKDVVVGFCTDTHHHGRHTEPVTGYARKYGISLTDAYSQDAGMDGVVSQKDWRKAIDSAVVEMVIEQVKGQLPPGSYGKKRIDIGAAVPVVAAALPYEVGTDADSQKGIISSMLLSWVR